MMNIHLPTTEHGRRRLVRAAQLVIALAIAAYLLVSTFVLLSLSDRNHELLREQKRSSEFHTEQARLSGIRTNDALRDISKDLRLQLKGHDRRIEELLKNLRIEVRALPDGTAKVVVTEAPRATVTATPKPRCERLPNGRCKRD